MSAPTLDRQEAAAHLLSLARSGGIVFVGAVDRARPFSLLDEIDEALEHAASLVAAGHDCYVTPGLFERGGDGGLNRDLKHVRGAWVAWCDVDGWDDGRQTAFERLRALHPSGAVFRLQSSPGRYHIYVRLDEKADAATTRRMNERLVGLFDGDPIPAQPATWMRLAGTVHQPKAKDRPDPLRSVPTAVTFIEQPGEGAVSESALQRALDDLASVPSIDEHTACQRLVGMRDGDGRNAAMTQFAGHVAVRCRDHRTAYDHALGEANALCAQPLHESELRSIADSIWDREHRKEPAREQSKKLGHATQLVELALTHYDLFRDADTDMAVAVRKGSAIGRPLKGNADALRAELAAKFYKQHRTVPSSTALADAIKALEGLALDAPAVPFAVRVGRADDGTIYYDLGDDSTTFVHIRPGEWSIVYDSPVRFLRTGLTAPQITPARSG
jgi:hypothetical protein